MKSFDKLFEKSDAMGKELLVSTDKLARSATKALGVVHHTDQILCDLDREFERRTKLNSTDIAFMMVAIGLQVARQYLLSQITFASDRPSDKEAANNTSGHGEEHSNRKHQYYNPSLDEIISNPVPFDAIAGSNGALAGGGSRGHRVKTLGHDPVIGLVVGTANIATATLTTTDLESYHIITDNKKDYFGNRASTGLVLEKTGEKLLYGGVSGRAKVGAALVKEIIHLKSDINSKHSLTLPGIALFDPKLASWLADYGFDMCNVFAVSKHAAYAQLINMLISMVHGAFYDEREMEPKLYQVKTRKIISYSNEVASASNLLYAFATRDLRKLDVGGLLVTIMTLINNRKFINKVKEEFIFGQFAKLLNEA